MRLEPRLIEFNKIGTSQIGFISVAEEQDNIPFEVKRVFWTYFTPEDVIRGFHAHHQTEMMLVAVSGHIVVTTEMPGQQSQTFELVKPHYGLYIPPLCWHTMEYTHSSVQLVLANTVYSEKDYIRNYETFKALNIVEQ